MKVIDVYKQYFAADCLFNTVQRNGAVVALTATSDAGTVKYDVSVSFFPHVDDEDYAINYDAYAEKEIYFSKGRRSKKREAELLKTFREQIDSVSAALGGKVFWDRPLKEARKG
ncbi:MAG: hypothetical protein IKS28_03010 [Clostridia bacterium]|nr:hypothetical protein [Clostridia bacterium]